MAFDDDVLVDVLLLDELLHAAAVTVIRTAARAGRSRHFIVACLIA
jgi:hypothetical protein